MKVHVRVGITAIIFLSIFGITSCLSVLESYMASGGAPTVTNAEAVGALKDALAEGVVSASKTLSARDGYFGNLALRILLPPEAKPVIDNISRIPQGQKLIDDVVLRLNRAAEHAASDVVPIFKDAIVAMTVADGITIIKGGDTAATDYFRSKTYAPLKAVYRPEISRALEQPLVLDISARQSWDTLSSAYNRAGAVVNSGAALAGRPAPMPPVQVDIAEWATERALDGLFLKVADEERRIRDNPLAYASALIRKVFGALKDGLL